MTVGERGGDLSFCPIKRRPKDLKFCEPEIVFTHSPFAAEPPPPPVRSVLKGAGLLRIQEAYKFQDLLSKRIASRFTKYYAPQILNSWKNIWWRNRVLRDMFLG
jgi:hypothetical protein